VRDLQAWCRTCPYSAPFSGGGCRPHQPAAGGRGARFKALAQTRGSQHRESGWGEARVVDVPPACCRSVVREQPRKRSTPASVAA
jgi:hypothetical protein